MKDLKKAAEEEIKLNVSAAKCKRAKKMVIAELDDSYKD